ncbi:hypothetical protein ACOMHN_036664 [Nucella lapillus]
MRCERGQAVERVTGMSLHPAQGTCLSIAEWLVCKYNESGVICVDRCGDNYDEFLQQLGEDDRAFAFVRVIMGDELSKRAKFAFITWTGANVVGLKKAKMSTDKSAVKKVISSFAAEINADSAEEVQLEEVRDRLMRAGGANYGTGQ